MNGQRNGWIVALLVVLVAAAAGGVAYNVGLSQGLTQVGASADTTPAYAYRHGHWGFGFFPGLFFLFFLLMAIKGFWWRPWGPWSYYHYGPRMHPRDRFDEWHRDAHAKDQSRPVQN